MKHCNQCKHFVKRPLDIERCAISGRFNIIDSSSLLSCIRMRGEYTGACGKEGKLFEPKPEQPEIADINSQDDPCLHDLGFFGFLKHRIFK